MNNPAIKSPCTKICRIEQGRCIGCGRTLEQIAAWPKMTSAERESVWPELELPPINLWNAPRGKV